MRHRFYAKAGRGNNPGHAVSPALGETAAHEIGHTLGLRHVSETFDSRGEGDHGERRAEPWPYPHGLMGDDGLDEFGAYAVSRDPANPSVAQWDIYIIDPCRGESFDERQNGCDLEDDADDVARSPHDLMSYGKSSYPLPGLDTGLISGRPFGRWMSPLNFRRAHRAAVTQTAQDLLTRGGPVYAHAVYAILPETGNGIVSPLISRDAEPRTITGDSENGRFTVEFVARDGRVLRSVTTDEAEVPDDDGRSLFVHAVVPFHPDVAQVVVKDDGVVRARSPAPQAPPSISLLSPGPGDTVAVADTVRVRWSASDPDGDPLAVLVEYSSDNGGTWTSAGLLDAGLTGLPLPATAFGEGGANRIRLMITDGALTATTQSQAPFTVTAEGPTGVREDPDPRGRSFLSPPEPNPAVGMTSVRLTLTEPAPVRVVVYDILGREALVGFDGRVGAGVTRVPLDVAGLSPGVYLVRAVVQGPSPTTESVRLTVHK